MKKIAIIGSGISGISAAYYLNKNFDVHVYEKSGYVGGHTNTISVSDGERTYGVDTAFMVFNRDNYKNLTKLFNQLNVSTLQHQGGFNFYDLTTGLNYGTRELSKDENWVAQHLPGDFIEVWREANRFFNEAPRHFFEGKTYVPLKEYLLTYGYSERFIDSYVVQLGSACWSLPADKMAEMPASTLIGFFMNHGQSGLGGQLVNWETVEHGSKQYLDKIQEVLRHPVRLNCKVQSVEKKGSFVAVTVNGVEEIFDKVIIATHADQALDILHSPTPMQSRLLGKIKYNRSEVVLHTDTSVLPEDQSRWESWNYGSIEMEGMQVPFLVYHMNKIHGFTAKKNFLVSIDSPLMIEEKKIIKRMFMEHPIINMDVYRMQDELYNINYQDNIYFTGTYFSIKRAGPDFAGFHESGISSAIEVVNLIEAEEDVSQCLV